MKRPKVNNKTSLLIWLNSEELENLARFVNRLIYDDIAEKAQNDDEAALMVAALDALREYLLCAGYPAAQETEYKNVTLGRYCHVCNTADTNKAWQANGFKCPHCGNLKWKPEFISTDKLPF